jgi:hypothetical protein
MGGALTLFSTVETQPPVKKATQSLLTQETFFHTF